MSANLTLLCLQWPSLRCEVRLSASVTMTTGHILVATPASFCISLLFSDVKVTAQRQHFRAKWWFWQCFMTFLNEFFSNVLPIVTHRQTAACKVHLLGLLYLEHVQELSSMFFLSSSTAKIVQILTENKIFKMSFNVFFCYTLEWNVVLNISQSSKTNYDWVNLKLWHTFWSLLPLIQCKCIIKQRKELVLSCKI